KSTPPTSSRPRQRHFGRRVRKWREKQGESVERRPYVNRIVCPPASAPLLRRLRPRARIPEQPRPIALVRLVRRGALRLLPRVEARPHVVPVPPRRRLRVLGRAGFEEVGVLDAVDQ